MVSHALPRMQWALVGAKRLECGSLLPLCFCAQTTCLSAYRHLRQGATRGAPNQLRVCPRMAPFDLAADPNGLSRAAADAAGVGRREALWSAAACCRFVSMHNQRAWNQIGMAHKTTCLSPYRVMKSPVRGACLKGTKLSNGTLWVTNPTRQRLTTSRKRVLRSCQQWQHEA